VEDPVEYNLPMLSQTQINPLKEFTYARALRSLMRQDPQVIMVGEIRDAETAAIAVQAGLTGHLVISTIHSDSTAGVFARLINMDIEPFLLASSVTGVMGLRLVRSNCPACSQPYDPDPVMVSLLTDDERDEAMFREGQGCERCMGTGFAGRGALSEMLEVGEVVRGGILEKMPTRSLQAVAVREGMRTLWQNGVRRVIAGRSPLEEIVRVVAVERL
jgi:general secretion pathway protein E